MEGAKKDVAHNFFAGNEGDNQPGRNHRRFKAEWASEIEEFPIAVTKVRFDGKSRW